MLDEPPPSSRPPISLRDSAFGATSLPALLGALLSPVVIFYGAGYLLSFGYFFAMGSALMTVFGSNELALMGFARLSGSLAVLAFLTFFAVTVGFYVGTIKKPMIIPARWANVFAGAVFLAAAAMIAFASWRANFLATMLGIVAIFVVGAIGVTVATGREEVLRRAGHPWRWMLPIVLLVLGLPSLGAAGFQEATEPSRALYIVVDRHEGAPRAMLLAAGAAAMIYQVNGKRYLAGPRGENPMEIAVSGRQRIAPPTV